MGILISLLEYFLPNRALENNHESQSRVHKRPSAVDERPGCSPRRRFRFAPSSNTLSTPPSDTSLFNQPPPSPVTRTNFNVFQSPESNSTQIPHFGSPGFSADSYQNNFATPHLPRSYMTQSHLHGTPHAVSDSHSYQLQCSETLPSAPQERVRSPSHESMTISPTLARPLRKEKLPDTFAGVKTELQDYLCHFDTVARTNGWDERDKGTNLAISLRGNAQQVLRDIPVEDREDYVAIVTALKRRFDPGERETMRRLEFRSRQRQRNETAVEFGFALHRLVNSAYPNMSLEARETLAIEQFIAGLSKIDLRRHVQFGHPTSIHQAISLATEFESFDTRLEDRKPEDAAIRAVGRKEDGDIANILKTLSAQVKSLSEAQTSLEARLAAQSSNPHMYPQSRPQTLDNQFQAPPPNFYPPRSQQPQRNTSNVPKNAQGLGQRQQRR